MHRKRPFAHGRTFIFLNLSWICALLGVLVSPDLGLAQVQTAWVARFKGAYGKTEPSALALDGQGNVYVTGGSRTANGFADYFTLKYNNAGSQRWARFYNGLTSSHDDYDCARAIAVDGQGQVYVTGQSSGTGDNFSDYLTLKYSSAGARLWTKRYNGPQKSIDVARALAVDSQGNICVTGESAGLVNNVDTGFDIATLKYSPTGQLLWLRRHATFLSYRKDVTDGGHAVAVDQQDNVYVTGESAWKCVTLKYSPGGQRQWVRYYAGPTGAYGSAASALAVDAQGYAYVTGRSSSGKDIYDWDYVTIKYSPSGQQLWVARYDGPASYMDLAAAIAVDGQGNVYVTGHSYDNDSKFDYATVKYGPNGKELWVRRYNGPGNDNDEARAIALDAQGNAYVTGYSKGLEYGYAWSDYATIKYSPDGEELWVARYDGPGSFSSDQATALKVDAQGNVYVTGISGKDCVTIKYTQP